MEATITAMSEYQYYEFQAIDRPLSDADREALRALSTRARITATSFTNSYEWGDFKGNPGNLMERWFDLHLYLANWGSRRLMIRLPEHLVDRSFVETFIAEADCVSVKVSGENLIVVIDRDGLEFVDWDDGSGWLAALAPLRAEVLAGDLRLFYLLWLTAVEADVFLADQPEPLPGIGPMSASLAAFAAFFGIDTNLVQAAAERPTDRAAKPMSAAAVREIIAMIAPSDQTTMLARLYDGDPHVAVELRARVRRRIVANGSGTPPEAVRTVGELRARAKEIGLEKDRLRLDEAEKVRRARLLATSRRGNAVWREVESEIERRNAAGYDKAVTLLLDLQAVAVDSNAVDDFVRQLRAIRQRHARKGQLIERLTRLG